jgi:uncharacterized metal-binding protein YceD (DUF177 family)
MYGVSVIAVRGERVHPECRTDEERRLTVQFYTDVEPVGDCARCGEPLREVPDA